MTNGEKEARRLRGGRGEEGRGEGRAWIRTRKCRTSRTRPRPRVWKLAETSFLRDIIMLLPISTCPSSLDPLLRLRAILRLECEPCAIHLLRAARGSRAPTRHARVGEEEKAVQVGGRARHDRRSRTAPVQGGRRQASSLCRLLLCPACSPSRHALCTLLSLGSLRAFIYHPSVIYAAPTPPEFSLHSSQLLGSSLSPNARIEAFLTSL